MADEQLSDFGSLSDLSLPSDFEDEVFNDNSRQEKEGNEQQSGNQQVSSSDESDEAAESRVKVRRGRKRKRFRRGLLYKRKGSRGQSHSESEGQQSEDYMNQIDSLLVHDPSDPDGDTSCAGTTTDTVESESEEDEAEDGLLEENTRPTTSEKKKKRKKRKTPLKSSKSAKYLSKNKSENEDDDDEDEDEDEDKDKDKDESSDTKRHVKSSVADLFREELDSALPNDAHLSTVANYLKLTLSDDWTVTLSPGMITLSKLCNMENPIVERAITWTNNKMNFLVLNQQLSSRHLLWQCADSPDIDNCGDIADCLTSASKIFDYFEVCPGITSHKDLWEKFSDHGIVYHNTQPASMRSKTCSHLMVYPGTCAHCRDLQRKMAEHERQKRRTASRESRDQSKVNIKYLREEELKEKIKTIQEEKRLAKQAVRRLRKRVDQLIKQNSEKVSSALSNDFVNIMNSNVDKMTQLEKIFWEQQSLALSKRGGKERTMRWHPAMIRLALHLRSLSPAAYEFLSGVGVITLPSERRLYDFSQFTEVQEGVQEDLLKILHKYIEENCPLEHQKYFNFILDEMSIRSELVYDAKTGELVGFTNLTSMENELASLEAEIQGKNYERRLAKKVLVFMLTGCTNDYKFVPAFFSTDDLSAAQLYTRVWDVIYAVEEVGAKVLVVIFDGASVNRKFIRLHFSMGDKDFTYATVNSTSGEQRVIYFMLDTPHLLKTFRNCFANSFAHRNSRYLDKDGQKISWKAIEALFALCEKYKCTKLTKAHVFLSSFSCMKVILAAQVFSDSVGDALERFKDVSPLKEEYTAELVKFIRHMNKAFDCLNGGIRSKKRESNPNLLEYTKPDDSRFDYLEKEFLGYLQEWEDYVSNKVGNYNKEQRSRMLISYQSLEAMKITVTSFIAVARFLLDKGAPCVSARNMNQDPLEQYFSEMRRKRGSDDNPNLKQVGHTRLSLQATQGMSSVGKRGNTQAEGQQAVVDESPLPVRKKMKKDN